jgi:hypothetical protein
LMYCHPIIYFFSRYWLGQANDFPLMERRCWIDLYPYLGLQYYSRNKLL